MKCARCGRVLRLAKVTVTTRAGQSSWGPVCARKAGLILPSDRGPRAGGVRGSKKTDDASQLVLELVP